MQDKQTTAFILLIIVAFLFWAYNKKTSTGNLLNDLVQKITGSNSSATGSVGAGAAIGASGATVAPTSSNAMPGTATTYTANYNVLPASNGQFLTPVLNAIELPGQNGTKYPFQIGSSVSQGDI